MARGLILVVEDDEDIRDTIAGILRGEGYRVETALHGLDALSVLERTRELPRAIVLDLMMPTMSGWEFRSRQKVTERIAQVPVVILTGDPRAREQSATLAPAAWVKKPISLTSLLDTIARVASTA